MKLEQHGPNLYNFTTSALSQSGSVGNKQDWTVWRLKAKSVTFSKLLHWKTGLKASTLEPFQELSFVTCVPKNILINTWATFCCHQYTGKVTKGSVWRLEKAKPDRKHQILSDSWKWWEVVKKNECSPHSFTSNWQFLDCDVLYTSKYTK